MKLDIIDSESPSAWWRRLCRRFKRLRDRPENGDSPYSLVLSLSLLLVVGVLVKIGH